MKNAVVMSFLWLAACGSGSTTQSPAETPSTQASQASIDGNIASASGALTIEVVGTSVATTTDSSGNFALVDVPEGATELHITGTGIDATITISTVMLGEHRTISISASGSNATLHHERSGSEFRGKVQSIDATNLTLIVSGRTVTTTSTTTFSKAGEGATFADIVVGDPVEVEGVVQADGSVVATKVEIAPAAPPTNTIVFVAKVQSNDGTSKLVAGDIPVTVTSSTLLVQANQTITLADIAVGDLVRVKGQLEAGPSVTANVIRKLTPRDVCARVFGPVTALAADGSSLTIGDTVVAVDASTVYGGSGAPESLADLALGDLVIAEAARQSDGTLLAKAVNRLPLPPPPPSNLVVLAGPLAAIGADSATIGDVTFKVDTTTVFGGAGDPEALADFAVGDQVVVKALQQTEGTLLAKAMMRLPSMPTTPTPHIAKGTIAAVAPAGITLTLASDPSKSQVYAVNAHTIIRIGDKPGTLADLKVGQTAEVASAPTSSATALLAVAIHVLP